MQKQFDNCRNAASVAGIVNKISFRSCRLDHSLVPFYLRWPQKMFEAQKASHIDTTRRNPFVFLTFRGSRALRRGNFLHRLKVNEGTFERYRRTVKSKNAKWVRGHLNYFHYASLKYIFMQLGFTLLILIGISYESAQFCGICDKSPFGWWYVKKELNLFLTVSLDFLLSWISKTFLCVSCLCFHMIYNRWIKHFIVFSLGDTLAA